MIMMESEIKETHLRPAAQMSREEKIEHFDELRKKYVETVARFESLKVKCEAIETEVKEAEIRNNRIKRPENKKKKSYGGLEESTGKWEEIPDDHTIPEGWKSCWRTMEGFSVGSKTKSYFAPNGRCCQSRLQALGYMVGELASSEEDVSIMREGLVDEGWKEDENLPPGWMFKGRKASKGSEKCWRFTTAEYVNLESAKAAVRHLLLYSTEQQLATFLKAFHGLLRDSEIVNWLSSPSLPFPWKVARTRTPSHKGLGLLLLSPEGGAFTKWVTCREAQERAGVEVKLLDTIEEFLANEGPIRTQRDRVLKARTSESGVSTGSGGRLSEWEEDENLPPGWKTFKSYGVKEGKGNSRCRTFLGPNNKFFEGIVAVLKYLLASNGRENELQTFKEYLLLEDWQTTEFLPPGFYIKQKQREQNFIVLNPVFQRLPTRHQLYNYLRQEGYGEEAVTRYQQNYKVLLEDRPTKPKNIKGEEDPDIIMDVKKENIKDVETTEEEDIKDVETTEEDEAEGYESDDSSNMSENTEAPSEGSNMSEDEFEEEDDYREFGWQESLWLPGGWRMAEHKIDSNPGTRLLRRYMSPCGRSFGGLQEALRFLLKQGEEEGEVAVMARGLECDGWRRVDWAREGWWTRGQAGGSRRFLAPNMRVFHELQGVKTYIQELECSELEIKEFMNINFEDDKYENSQPGNGHQFPAKNSLNQFEPKIKVKKEGNPETEKKPNQSASIESELKSSESSTRPGNKEDGWLTDDSLPEGWRVSHSGGTDQFLSPEERTFTSRTQAIKYLNTVAGRKEEMERLVVELWRDGWEEQGHLPQGWLTKQREDGDNIYLTQNFETLKSVKKALSYMTMKNYSQEVVDRFLTGRKPQKRSAEEEGGGRKAAKEARMVVETRPVEEKEATHPLPPGWKEEGAGLVSPQGRRFSSRVAAVEWMIQSKAASEHIYAVWAGLESEGWRLATSNTTLLPGGWRLRREEGVMDWWYLSRQCRVLRSTEQARQELASCPEEYDASDLARFDMWAGEQRSEAIVWVLDPALPEGWSVSQGLEQDILRDQRGARFASRKEAIDHLIREQYSPGDIFRLWSTLEREGWLGDETTLPTGWKRKFYPSERRHHYLSPMMEVVWGTMALQEVVGRGREYSREEVDRLEQWRVREEQLLADMESSQG